MSRRRSVLWVDNHAVALEGHANILRENGLDVTLIDSADDCLKLLQKRADEFDLIMVDLRLMEGPEAFLSKEDANITNGIQLINEIQERHFDLPVCVLSSYLQLEEYKSALRDMDIKGELIDKYVEDVTTDEFRIQFIEPIIRIANRSVHGMIGTIDKKVDSRKIGRNVSPFMISYETYLRLSKSEQAAIRKRAKELSAPVWDAAQKDGATWVLIMGRRDRVVARADSEKEIWEAEKVRNKAWEENRVPFQFEMARISDDSWHVCGASAEFNSYPVIRLTVQSENGSKEKEWLVHFDTGTWDSYFSLEEFMELGRFRDYADMVDSVYKQLDYSFRKEWILVILKNKETGATYAVKTQIKLVEDWLRTSFVAPCPSGCRNNRKKTWFGIRNCVNRNGLIGRSIIMENDFKVIFGSRNPEILVQKYGEKS